MADSGRNFRRTIIFYGSTSRPEVAAYCFKILSRQLMKARKCGADFLEISELYETALDDANKMEDPVLRNAQTNYLKSVYDNNISSLRILYRSSIEESVQDYIKRIDIDGWLSSNWYHKLILLENPVAPILESCSCGIEQPSPPNIIEPLVSPIVLGLDGDGVETVSKENDVYFNHDGNLFVEKTGWVGADDALLVHDRNGDGKIDGDNELFGNNYTLANGKKAANGFEALAEFDSNGDGVVDRNDERWGELKLWQDKNGNGVVDDGEIMTMEEAGVAGLNVNYINRDVTDENGNKHMQQGSFIREDGTTGK